MGGGPSLRGFDFDLLHGRTVLAVNEAAVLLPLATALFSLDPTWIRERRDFLCDFSGEKFLAPPDDGDEYVPGACYLRRSREEGLSLHADTVCLGCTSGYGALNVAFLKRARRIFLLGYDYSYSNGTHWFGGYSWNNGANGRYQNGWAAKFNAAASILRHCNVEVINVGVRSRICAFPRIKLEEFTEELRSIKQIGAI